jgi:cob(I)alamin adenosyltransferase
MVTLSRIYTRNGDAGKTRLSDMSLTTKTDPRVHAYGDVDEANSLIGLALATGGLPENVAAALHEIQNELFDVGADLSNPLVAEPEWEPLRIVQSSVDRLEDWCDSFGKDLPTLTSFILPGGTPAAATLHLARTVVRRAERAAWAAVEAYGTAEGVGDLPGGVNLLAIAYLNRLSDLLFLLARAVNGGGETLWVPGKDREPTTAKGRRQRDRIAAQQAESPSVEG